MVPKRLKYVTATKLLKSITIIKLINQLYFAYIAPKMYT